MNIATRTDSKRGCGWRKPGGLYLIASGLARACGALPAPLHRCPACGHGIKQTRGWTWVDAGLLLAPGVALCAGPPAVNPSRAGDRPDCGGCALRSLSGRHGLIWIGGAFYKTPEDFSREAVLQGVSRRIHTVPHGFKLGETWVLVAHLKACPPPADAVLDAKDQLDRKGWTPGIFHAFRPTAIEYVVKGDESDDDLQKLIDRDITPVRVERNPDPAEQATLAGAP